MRELLAGINMPKKTKVLNILVNIEVLNILVKIEVLVNIVRVFCSPFEFQIDCRVFDERIKVESSAGPHFERPPPILIPGK